MWGMGEKEGKVREGGYRSVNKKIPDSLVAHLC